MKVTFRDLDGKGRRYADALEAHGHQIVGDAGDVLLIDYDPPLPGYQALLDGHDLVFLYPHGAGLVAPEYEHHPHVRGRLVYGQGQVEAYATWDDTPSIASGWALCDLAPFRSTQGHRVLLAPDHALSCGWIPESTYRLNGEVHDALAKLDLDLTVRYIPHRGLGGLGIVEVPGVVYDPVGYAVATDAIDQADIVVTASSTFGSLAVARGCPTIMYDQFPSAVHDSCTHTDCPITWPESARYPLDWSDGEPEELIAAACASEATEWRERFIGEQLDPAGFVEAFEQAVEAC